MMACSSKPSVSTRIWRFLPLTFLPASYPCGSMQPPLFQRSSRFGYRRWRRSGWLLVRLAPDTPHKARDGCDPACRRSSTSRDSRKVCCAAADLRDRTPLASRAQNIHDPVHHFAHLDMALVAAALGGRDQWFDMRPFIVGQVTRISQFAAVVTS